VKTKSVKKATWIEATPPDGSYSGIRGGYIVAFTASDGLVYNAETEEGIRGFGKPCSVSVVGGVVAIT